MLCFNKGTLTIYWVIQLALPPNGRILKSSNTPKLLGITNPKQKDTKMKEELISSIGKMIVNGNRLELPKEEVFKNYAHVKKTLLNAGGKYKKCGFEFTGEAEQVKQALVGGEVINDKKKYQFFPTPIDLVKRIVKQARLENGQRVLEPSAGQGAIADELCKVNCELHTVELMPESCRVLESQGHSVVEGDFLSLNPDDIGLFDRIVANPPFTKNQDIDHIKKMFGFLASKGRLVSLASKSWMHGSQKKQVAFREWLNDVGAEISEVEAGAFKESGTNIATVIIDVSRAA
jgi:phospholipid N-methyltransferase